MHRLGSFIVRRSKAILVSSVVILILAGAVGGSVVEHLSTGGFEDLGSESAQAAAIIEEKFGVGDPHVLLLVTSKTGSVDDPEVAAAGSALTKELSEQEGVESASSYWSLNSAPPLRSTDGSKALVLATMSGADNEINSHLEVIAPRFDRSDDTISVEVGGFSEVFRQITYQVEADLVRAELLALPFLLLLLLLVFRSGVAATLPLGVGVIAVLGTLLVLRAVAAVTEVSIFALNLTTGMGLGLGIDYSLFVVSRFREEMAANGNDVDASVIRTVQTAGKTVVFSAIAVAASLSALLVFPLVFLRSFAYAGIPVAMVAGAGATITLPALLKVLGPRIEKLSLRRRAPKALGEGGWHRIAVAVMKRPIPVATIGILILLFLGSPFLGVRMGLPDDRVLPPDAPGRVVSDEIRASFGGNEAFALSILLDDPAAASDNEGIEGLAAEISSFEEIARVDSARGSFVGGHRLFFDEALSNRFISGSATYLSAVLVPTVETQSPEAEAVVERIRGLGAEYELLVTGASAELVDSKSIVLSRVPIALGWIAIVTFVALFLLFGSVIVPIKAVLLNLLSLTATFGAMVWVFQEGNLSSVLNFTATGSLVLGNIILMFCIAFGLSMDYEVFLLSRIKEEHDITGDNDGSVAVGLERTGRIVTAAAALISIVFIAMLSSGVSFIKLFGMGLSLAVIMDATLVRAFLVPAFMKMMGGANWWAPPALRRFHNRFGISEAPSSPAPASVSGGSQ